MPGPAARFFSLVFRPIPRVWGAVTVGIPTAAALIAWALDYGLWAAGIGLVSLAILLAWAGIRLQRRLDTLITKRELREQLAAILDKGREVQHAIMLAAGMALAEEQGAKWPSPESDAAKMGWSAKRMREEWEKSARDALATMGSEYVALFYSSSGLPSVKPPADWFYEVGWADAWEQVHHRCIRLEEFIKEIRRE